MRRSIYIDISKDFSSIPGARYPHESSFCGQDFREKLLYPAVLEALEKDMVVVVNMDGVYGFSTAFLDEAFGGLTRVKGIGYHIVRHHVVLISTEEPSLIEEVDDILKDSEFSPDNTMRTFKNYVLKILSKLKRRQ
jgi:hypothetical protein